MDAHSHHPHWLSFVGRGQRSAHMGTGEVLEIENSRVKDIEDRRKEIYTEGSFLSPVLS